MENVNFLLVFQVTFYVLTLALSICLFVPICIHLHNFRGNCLLFSSGKWDSSGHFDVQWSSEFFCDYGIFIGIMLLIIGLVQVYRLSSYLIKRTDSSFLSAFIDTVGSILLVILTLICAIFISLGFKAWCDSIKTRYISCRNVSSSDLGEKTNIIMTGFYIQFGTAQFASWGAWVCTIALTVVAILKMCKYHQQANIAISMAKERQRLLGEMAGKPS